VMRDVVRQRVDGQGWMQKNKDLQIKIVCGLVARAKKCNGRKSARTPTDLCLQTMKEEGPGKKNAPHAAGSLLHAQVRERETS